MGAYYLKHKNDICGTMVIDDVSGRVIAFQDNDNGLSPYLGNSTVENIKKWWLMRAIPASRETIKSLINSLEVNTSEEYLAKNLALSVTDTYWICPVNMDLKYEDINFFNLKEYNDGKIPYHNSTSYDPNASLGGQMEKYWDLSEGIPRLVKESYKYFGQQSVNEVVASIVYERQNNNIKFVKYECSLADDGGRISVCDAFTTRDIELVSAYEVLSSVKVKNDISNYEAYINICVENGIEKEQIQDFMDYQTSMDFILSNTDEHMMNFGVIRDANTMKLIGPAPIYDTGNSMFYADLMKRSFTRVEILGREIASFYKNEEKMLSHIKNRNIVKMDLLPSPDEIKEIYCNNGQPEDRAELISKNYYTKIEMFKEFQQGKTISLFSEKKKA